MNRLPGIEAALAIAAHRHGFNWKRTHLKETCFEGWLDGTGVRSTLLHVRTCPNYCCISWTNSDANRVVGDGDGPINRSSDESVAQDLLASAMHCRAGRSS